MLIFIISIVAIGIIIGCTGGIIKGSASIMKARGADDSPVGARVIDIKHGSWVTRAIFELEDGNRISLPLPDKVGNVIMVGDSGFLTYHGEVFKAFEKGCVSEQG